jgi:two-component system, sensor histidine kinase and response regulator
LRAAVLHGVRDQVVDDLPKALGVAGDEHRVGGELERDGMISVKDQGLGIPSSEVSHLFERFHRAPNAGGRGHGLGLYIASALAQLHGGTIRVESTEGSGSTFQLLLPVAAN